MLPPLSFHFGVSGLLREVQPLSSVTKRCWVRTLRVVACAHTALASQSGRRLHERVEQEEGGVVSRKSQVTWDMLTLSEANERPFWESRGGGQIRN